MSARVDATLLGRVLELWGLGESAGKIAERLGLTRNQAMGMIHRAKVRGLCGNHGGVNFKPGPLNGHRPYKRHKPVILRGPQDEVAPTVVNIMGPPPAVWPEPVPCALPSGVVFGWYSDGGCRFILNDDPRHPQWCNQPTSWGPWCNQHRAIVYTRYVPKF